MRYCTKIKSPIPVKVWGSSSLVAIAADEFFSGAVPGCLRDWGVSAHPAYLKYTIHLCYGQVVSDLYATKLLDNSTYVKALALMPSDILRERQAGWEERCAQGKPENTLDQSPKSVRIS